jgi:hypothetical protein
VALDKEIRVCNLCLLRVMELQTLDQAAVVEDGMAIGQHQPQQAALAVLVM